MRGFSRDALITALVLAVVALMASACSSKEVPEEAESIKIYGDEGVAANAVTFTGIALTPDPSTRSGTLGGLDPVVGDTIVDQWLKVYVGKEVYYLPLFR